MNTDLFFSSETDQWATPLDFFKKVDAVFRFETDVCADAKNAKCEKFFDAEANGLKQIWTGVCWMNPPYGSPESICGPNCKKKSCQSRGYHNAVYKPGIEDWVKKDYESSLAGATVVCLVPARTCSAWWQDYIVKGEIMLIRGRLKFGNSENSAPFPSALVVFRPSLKNLDVLGMVA